MSRRVPYFVAAVLLLACASRLGNQAHASAIVLPPFIVVGKYKLPPWRYGAVPGYEVLSLCSDDATERFFRSAWKLDRYLDLIAPPELQMRFSAPRALILYSGTIESQIREEMAARMREALQRQGAVVAREGAADQFAQDTAHLMPNLFLPDQDSVASFCLLDERSWISDEPPPLYLTEGEIRFLLEGRRPSLPRWFVEGVLALFSNPEISDRGLALRPLIWVNLKKTQELEAAAAQSAGHDLGPYLIPVERFVESAPPAGGGNSADWLEWRSEAELFVRWGCDPASGADRAAFRKFIERSSGRPPTARVFKDCFGFAYGEMRSRLGRYLTVAMGRGVSFGLAGLPASDIAMRRATAAEIGRLQGDWERRSLAFVRKKYPDFEPAYEEQARGTLLGPYNRGETDPGLMATIGQFEFDLGRNDQARPFLELAARGGVPQPLVWAELAKVRCADFLRHPAGAGGRLGAGQVAEIKRILAAAEQRMPPLKETYDIMVQMWAHASVGPTAEDLAELDAGARLFGNPRLLLGAALVEAGNGWAERARALVALGLEAGPDAEVRPILLQVQAGMASKSR